MGLSDEQIAALDSGAPRIVNLVELFFASETVRIWDGYGDLEAGGKLWRGGGVIGRMPEIEQLINGQASKVTVEISGVDAAAYRTALSEADEISGSKAHFWYCLLGQDGQPIGDPVSRRQFMMEHLKVDRTGSAPPELSTRSISIDLSDRMITRARAPYSYWSDRDQKGRSPTDRICERVTVYKDHRIPNPGS